MQHLYNLMYSLKSVLLFNTKMYSAFKHFNHFFCNFSVTQNYEVDFMK